MWKTIKTKIGEVKIAEVKREVRSKGIEIKWRNEIKEKTKKKKIIEVKRVIKK